LELGIFGRVLHTARHAHVFLKVLNLPGRRTGGRCFGNSLAVHCRARRKPVGIEDERIGVQPQTVFESLRTWLERFEPRLPRGVDRSVKARSLCRSQFPG
jgi:hypothetical protein